MTEGHRRRPLFAAGLMATSAAFVLAGYEFMRTPSNTLFVITFGKERLPLVTALIPVAVALLTYLYVRLLSWLGPRKTLLVTSLGSAIIIASTRLALAAGFEAIIWPIFLLREAYVVLLIEQYWSFLNSTLTQAEGRKFNGPICGIASLGSIAAGVIGASVTERFGTANMLLFSALATLPAAFISDFAYRRFGEPKAAVASEAQEKKPKDHLALGLFRTERVLPLLLLIVVATQIVATVLGLAFQGTLLDTFPDADKQSAYSYAFYAWVNGAAAVLQFVGAPLLMHFVRPGLVHLLIPLIHVVACSIYLQDPTMTRIAFAYAAFKSVDYSIFRAAKEVLYIPLPFAARYRAKEVIDVFGYRVSKGVTSGVITLLQNAGVVFSEGVYAAIALATSVLWMALALPLGRHYKR